MQELIETIVRALVDTPDAVIVTEGVDAEGWPLYTVYVAPREAGQVLGKAGRISNAIRTLARTVGNQRGKRNARVVIEAN